MKFISKHQSKKPRFSQKFEEEFLKYEGQIIDGIETLVQHESKKLKVYENIQAQNAFVITPEILMSATQLERDEIIAKNKRSSYRADISDIPAHSAEIASFLEELDTLDKDILKGRPVKQYLKDRIAEETAKQNAKEVAAKKAAKIASEEKNKPNKEGA